MIYGYARVSTKGQARDGNSLEEQTAQLKARGAEVIYADSFTGTKVHRPELDKLLTLIQSGDTLVVTKLDRVARSTIGGIELITDLRKRGVTVDIINMGVLNDTPTGNLMMHIMLAFAEYERDMIVQRTSEGKAIARQRADYREGRKPKAVDAESFNQCRQRVSARVATVTECCKELGISRTKWYSMVRDMEGAA